MTQNVREQFVIGVDDTDVPDIGGTGKLVRALAERVEAEGFGVSLGVTRHQLLNHPKIPMTKRNSSAALGIETERGPEDIEQFAVAFVREQSEPGSDPGVAVLSRHSDMPHILAFGRRSQQELMKLLDAERFSTEGNVRLRALGDEGSGMIGALAAAGLRAGGGDGRYVGLNGIRELEGNVTAGTIRAETGILKVLDEESGEELDRDDVVYAGDWVRPRLIEGAPVLLTRRSPEDRKVWLPVDRKSDH